MRDAAGQDMPGKEGVHVGTCLAWVGRGPVWTSVCVSDGAEGGTEQEAASDLT